MKTGYVKKNQPETCTACAGTLILEFAALSRYTKDPIYEEKARKALDQIWRRRHQGSSLVGTGSYHFLFIKQNIHDVIHGPTKIKL